VTRAVTRTFCGEPGEPVHDPQALRERAGTLPRHLFVNKTPMYRT
jgi:hypothetical protein